MGFRALFQVAGPYKRIHRQEGTSIMILILGLPRLRGVCAGVRGFEV